jgi:hypothetical protein
MPNLSFLKRLIKEDFEQKDRELVDKIASILNPALEQITIILNRGLKVEDLNAQVKDLEITVDSDGFPTSDASFKSTLKGKCTQIMVGRVQAINRVDVYPTGGHSVTFSDNGGQVVVNHITGLPPNIRFTVRLTAYA